MDNKTGEIINCTPHEIVFFKEEDCYSTDGRKLFLRDGAVPSEKIPAGVPLNAVKKNVPVPQERAAINYGVPLVGAVVFQSCDPLPPATEDTIFIVSNLYRAARLELGLPTTSCATVDGVVYENAANPKPVGCLRLAVG
jgi:hypothetical protein